MAELPTPHLIFFFFSILGLPLATKLIINLLWFPYAYFLRRPKHLPSTYGSWAVVTGPTSGIGEAISMELAGAGLNLLLVGRSSSKLATVSTSISLRYPAIKILKLTIDLALDPQYISKKIKEAVEGLDVGILVNNAGVSYTKAMYFHQDGGDWEELVRVNIVATTAVTAAIIPGMVDKGRGAIVNIGSGAATIPPAFPLYSVYAATKTYIDQLSRSLTMEYRNKGIDVQCQVPMYVKTKMVSKKMAIKWYHIFVASPETYARAAVRWIGYDAICTPYWLHYIQWSFASLVPKPILGYIIMCGNLSYVMKKEI